MDATVAEQPPDTAEPADQWRGAMAGGLRWTARLVLALIGATLGVLLVGPVTADVGPFVTRVGLDVGSGTAKLAVPPLGELTVDAYDGPVGITVTLQRVDRARAEVLLDDPVALARVGDEAAGELRGAVISLAVRSTVAAVLGAAVLSALATRRPREIVWASLISLLLLLGAAGLGVGTWRPDALTRPTYTGLLAEAPALIGSATDIATRFEDYRRSLSKLVANVSTLYAAVSTLPSYEASTGTITLLHVSDLHLNPTAFDLIGTLVSQFGVDAVLDTGDIVDWGSQPEAAYVAEIGRLGVPYLYVRGNHDSAATQASVAAQPNAVVLDDSGYNLLGLQIVGIGDPRFTPDKSGDGDAAGDEVLLATGEQLLATVEANDTEADIAMVHDPVLTAPLDGTVSLILAGHRHQRDVRLLDGGSRLMVQGSTGGAGLRGLEGEDPTPLTATILFVDQLSGDLEAYDEITLGGLGQSEVTVVRTVVTPSS